MLKTIPRTLIAFVGINRICNAETKYASAQTEKKISSSHILIVGGGTGGVGVAAMLHNDGVKDITIIEPSNDHYYQPFLTLVGAGMKIGNDCVIPMNDMIRDNAYWVQNRVVTLRPDASEVELENGDIIKYNYLVVAAGIQLNWDKIEGLQKALVTEGSGVTSIYSYQTAEKTRREIDSIKEGRAIFTMPATIIKCAGAPQKIMWLFEEKCRDRGIRDDMKIEFWVPGVAMFGVKKYADILESLRQERNVQANFSQELIAVDGTNKIATFRSVKDPNVVSQQYFDLLHVVPPMSAPTFIASSPLANAQGWLDVDRATLQSTKYENVFAIGDCTSTPNSKTAAAITKQAPVLVHNLQQHMAGRQLDGKYNGYASCPVVVGKKRAILAEFGYDGKLMETFSSDGKFPFKFIGQEGERCKSVSSCG